MLDTSKIPTENLEQAMYEESMNSWSEAYANVYSTWKYICKTIDILETNTNESVSTKNYAMAAHYGRDLLFSTKEFQKYTQKLINLQMIQPRSLEESLNKKPKNTNKLHELFVKSHDLDSIKSE